MTKREWRITHNTVPGEFVTHTKIRDKDDTVIATLHADDEVNGPLIIRAVNANDELVAIAERVKFQKHAIRGALIASGHTSALEFFDATLALIESTDNFEKVTTGNGGVENDKK